MGSVTILQSLGAGYYAVRINFDNSRIEARKTAIQAELDGFTAKLTDLEAKKAPFDAVLAAAKTALDSYTKTATPQQLVNDQATLNKLIEQVFKAQIDVELAAKDIALLKLKKTALDKELAYLAKNCPSTIETTAWCVEYKEDLTGTLESIEVDYLLERDNITDQIRNDTGVWLPGTARTPTARLQHVLATSSFATWFNLCMAPAMQRHKPMYRIATITALDKNANTCDLDFVGRYDVDRYSTKLIADKPILPNFEQEMDAAAGYGNYKIPPAQQIHYTGAKVEYGSCNAKAFEVGDKVIVDLHKGVGVPTVIGFYENPRKCGNDVYIVTLQYDQNQMYDSMKYANNFEIYKLHDLDFYDTSSVKKPLKESNYNPYHYVNRQHVYVHSNGDVYAYASTVYTMDDSLPLDERMIYITRYAVDGSSSTFYVTPTINYHIGDIRGILIIGNSTHLILVQYRYNNSVTIDSNISILRFEMIPFDDNNNVIIKDYDLEILPYTPSGWANPAYFYAKWMHPRTCNDSSFFYAGLDNGVSDENHIISYSIYDFSENLRIVTDYYISGESKLVANNSYVACLHDYNYKIYFYNVLTGINVFTIDFSNYLISDIILNMGYFVSFDFNDDYIYISCSEIINPSITLLKFKINGNTAIFDDKKVIISDKYNINTFIVA